MPSPQTVTTNFRQVAGRHSRLTLGVVAAASVATVASVGGAPAASAATIGGAPAAQAAPGGAGTGPFAVSDHTTTNRVQPGPFMLARPATPTQQVAAPAPAPVATTPAVAHPAPVQSPVPPAPAPVRPASPPPPPAQPYQLYDSVTPSSIPASSGAVAVYANGSYAASPSQVGAHRGVVLWIDTNGSDPHASVLDVEPGDATPSQAAAWVQQKLNGSPNSSAIVYTMRSQWGAVQSAVSQLPWWMPSHTKYWIADPTGVPHVVPGSQATQWYWGQNYDISTAMPGFGF